MLNVNPTEQETRKNLIDPLLEKARWNIKDKSQVIKEFEIAGTGIRQRTMEEDEYDPSGFSDYLLYNRVGDPIAVIEAKRTSRDPIAGKQQAEDYANGIKRICNIEPFIFLTNGYETWFWNRERYAPMMVHGFFSQKDLERILHQNNFQKALNSIPIKPEIIDRDYQIEAVKRILEGLNKCKRKFLLVMATGSGKTRTAMALIDVLLKAGWTQRVLFLVDRDVLAKQAIDAFKEHLPNESKCRIYSAAIKTEKSLYVSTIQTMMNCFTQVTPGFFDVIISDECHRSIYNKWKDVLSYFHAINIGLTATPSSYIERDTFRFFNCDDGLPTFNYCYKTAVEEKILVDFRPAYSAQTNFQIKGIRGEKLPPSIQRKLIEEGHKIDDIDFEGTELERKVTNLPTNESLVKEFMDVSIKDETGVIPGKSIIFAMSHKHAVRIWKIFNELYPEYKGQLVEIIDSRMERPLELIRKFKEQTFPRVAISVDMLDTGIDIHEIVNLVFAKPVFSKIKFWQMIGRGTRILKKDITKRKIWCSEKDRFLIIDHWNNFEYFGEKPEGKLPAVQEAVPVKIFRTRLVKLNIFLQKNNYKFFEKIKSELINDIKSLPETSDEVHKNLRHVDNAVSEQIWKNFDNESFNFLLDTISPLMRYQSNINLYQVQFLLKTEKLGLAVLQNNNDEIEIIKASIINDIKLLPRNLSAVKAKEKQINEVLSEEFWLDLNYDKCEYIKEHLTEIMKNKLKVLREIIELDIDDNIIQRKWIQFGPLGEGDYVDNYRRKVEQKILDLVKTHPALKKINDDIPITDFDLMDLEETLNNPELYINEDNLRKAFFKPWGTFIQFIKHILGKFQFPDSETIINEAFNTYTVERNNEEQLTSEQLNFLRTIKNVFAKKKHIEYNDLFEPPFTNFGNNAASRLFSENELKEIIGIFNKLAG